MGERSGPVQYASAPSAGTWSHTAARNISMQARSTDIEVPSAVEGKTFSDILLFHNVQYGIKNCLLKASWFGTFESS